VCSGVGGARKKQRVARSSVCARKAGAHVNGISRKQQRVCACSGRAVVNGRARKQEGVRADQHKFKFKWSLKTSAIASHGVFFGVREAPCTTGRSSKGQLQQQRVM
jgi:hypothetical protein